MSNETREAVIRLRFFGDPKEEMENIASELIQRSNVTSVTSHYPVTVDDEASGLEDECVRALERHEAQVDQMFETLIDEIAFNLQVERETVVNILDWHARPSLKI